MQIEMGTFLLLPFPPLFPHLSKVWEQKRACIFLQ